MINESFESQLITPQSFECLPEEWPEIPTWVIKVVERDDSTVESCHFSTYVVREEEEEEWIQSNSGGNRQSAICAAFAYANGWCIGQGASANINFYPNN